MATLQNIADMVGVSKSTVSRVLRADPTLMIQNQTREKILQCAEQVGYQVKKEKLLSTVGIVAVIHKDTHFLNQLDNSYYFTMRYAIEQYCLKERLRVAFYPLSFLKDVPTELQGAVIMGNFTEGQQKQIFAALPDVPKVFIGKVNCLPDKMDWVKYDVKTSVYLALELLRKTNHHSVLYLGGFDVDGTPVECGKRIYFEQFLQEHPEMSCADIVESIHGTESGYHMMKEWLKTNSGNIPDAVFVSNDPLAFGALQALYEYRISVPTDISVISINGDSPASTSTPPLTTVDLHASDMGVEAIKCIIEQSVEKRKNMKSVSFQPSLVIRKSVREL